MISKNYFLRNFMIRVHIEQTIKKIRLNSSKCRIDVVAWQKIRRN